MWKIKQRDIYQIEYDIKLNNGKCFKANTELKSILSRQECNIDEEKVDLYEKLRLKKVAEIRSYKQIVKEKTELLARSKSGDRDEEYQEKYDRKEEDKRLNKEKRDDKKNKTNKSNKELSQRYYQNSYQSRRKERFKEKDYKYHYKIFLQKSNSIPNWMKKKLERMKNNEGYIWKKVWFFGALQQEDTSNLTMIEYTPQKIYTKLFRNGTWTIKCKPNPRYKKSRNYNSTR